MSKHETSNQFKDGLMMDVHPLQTPNTVLTDCLNGTFITYNGNEHVLQNDMGNFKLSKCKLKENYIPVGTASYGDILYIASYNPIDKKFELGSYPSPLQWGFVNGNKNGTIPSIIEYAIEKWKDSENRPNLKYSELSQYSFPVSFADKSLKLQPGDEYSITETGTSTSIEALEYFIMDDNKNLHSINVDKTGKISPVRWEIPGYLYVKNRILAPYEHKFKIVRAIVGNTSVTFRLQSIISIDDPELLRILDHFCDNLILKIRDSKNQDSEQLLYNENAELENKYNLQITSWLNDGKRIILEYDYIVHNLKLTDIETVDEKEVVKTLTESFDLYCTLIYKGDGFDLQYDGTLDASLTYTANGNNQKHVAQDEFYWTAPNTGEQNYKINVDVFDDGVGCYFTYSKLEELSTISDINNMEWSIVNGDSFEVVSPNTNTLYLILFKFGETHVQDISDVVGRFAYFGIDSIPNTRADVLLTLDSVAKNYFGGNTISKYTFSDFIPKYETDFLNNFYDKKYSKLEDWEKKYLSISAEPQPELSYAEWTSSKQSTTKVDESSRNTKDANNTMWEHLTSTRALTRSLNDPVYYTIGSLPEVKLTSEVYIISTATKWKQVDSVKQLSSQRLYLYWVHEYSKLQAAWFRKGSSQNSEKWLDYCFVGGDDPYKKNNDSRVTTVMNSIIDSIGEDKIALLYIGVSKNHNAGARVVITSNFGKDVIWSVDDKGTEGSWHFLLKNEDGSYFLYKPVDNPKGKMEDGLLYEWWNYVKWITWKFPTFTSGLNGITDWSIVSAYYGNTITHDEVSSPEKIDPIYEVWRLSGQDNIGKWLLTQTDSESVLGIFKDANFDTASRIEKLNPNYMYSGEVTVKYDIKNNNNNYTFTEEMEYPYIIKQLDLIPEGNSCEVCYMAAQQDGEPYVNYGYITNAIYLENGQLKLRSWMKDKLTSATYYFRTQKASGKFIDGKWVKEFKVATGPLNYYYGKPTK